MKRLQSQTTDYSSIAVSLQYRFSFKSHVQSKTALQTHRSNGHPENIHIRTADKCPTEINYRPGLFETWKALSSIWETNCAIY